MEECVRAMQQTLRGAPSIKKRAKTVYSQRNLGTIKNRKREKKEEKEVGGGETIMRILRMRYVLPTQSSAFFFSTFTELVTRALQTKYVRLYRATITDFGDDAGRAGTAGAPTAEADGPEARQCNTHPRRTSCARNTSLTFGEERLPYIPIPGNINSFFFFRRCGYLCARNSIPSIQSSLLLLCSLLATSIL